MEAWLLLLVLRLAIAALPLKAFFGLARFWGAVGKGRCRPGADAAPSRSAWAVEAAARRLPFRATCLVRACAGAAMMKRRGHEPILRIGARKTSQGALEAHAWVEVFEQPVIGELADLPSYRQFPAFVL